MSDIKYKDFFSLSPAEEMMQEISMASDKTKKENTKLRCGLKHIKSICENPYATDLSDEIIKKCEELLSDN